MACYDTILFDFDGTIMNTMEGITRGVESALLRLGITPPPRSELVCFIGPPILDGFLQFIRLDHETAQLGVTYYREYYSMHGLTECEPYPGIQALLEHLRNEKKIVALATSKPQVFAETILKNTGLLSYFDILSGAALDGSHNAKEDVIRRALTQCPGHDLARCIMVGDRHFDISGAHAVGLPCVGVLYGFGSRTEFEEAGADFIAADASELAAILLA